MKKMSAVAMKLCAAMLSVLLVIGAIPIALAVDTSNNSDQADEAVSAATPDEAVESDQYPLIKANDGVKTYMSSEGRFYVNNDGLAEITVMIEPNGEIKALLEEDAANEDFSKLNTSLRSGQDETGLNSRTAYSYSGGILTAKINTKDWDIGAKDYTLTVRYNKSEQDSAVIFEKGLTIVGSGPDISEVKYDGSDEMSWVKDSVEITFDVSSQVSCTVTVNGEEVNGSDGSYSYEASGSGERLIKAVDLLGNEDTFTTPSILSDVTAPVVESCKFFDENNNEITGWTNKPITAKLTVKEAESGIDVSTLKLNELDPSSVSDTAEGKVISFAIDAKKDYSFKCADAVGNECSYDIKADDIKLDTDAPAANDFTLTFSDADNAGDMFLSMLTFGAYSRDDVAVSIAVDDKGLSEINPDSVKLYNGDEELVKNDGKYILTAPENDGESNAFDLYVEASDLAGNNSGKIRFADQPVKTMISGSDTEVVRDLSENLYELVISKVIPSYDENYGTNGEKFDFEHVKAVDGKTYVSGDGKLSVKTSEEVTGIKEVKATLDVSPIAVTLGDTDTDKKIEEQVAEVTLTGLTKGEHTVEFTATANSGKQSTKSITFTSITEAPKLDGNITLSNASGGTQEWVNDDVTVEFKFEDTPVGIDKVRYYNSTKTPSPKASDIKEAEKTDDGYAFDAEDYGQYQIIATDGLGNIRNVNTPVILIDKADPEVVDGEFNYDESWTNSNVNVEFEVKDNPGNCSGIDKVTVNGVPATLTGNVCSFTADHYGDYEVVVFDKAKNCKEYTVGPILIDTVAPVIDSVTFSEAENVKSYGTYANIPLEMTVVISDPLNSDQKCSGLDVTEIREDGSALTPDSSTSSGNKVTLKYTVDTSDDIHGFTFYAKDKAKNEAEFKLINNCTTVNIYSTEKLYEVVATLAKPVIDDIDVKFTQGPVSKDGNNYYSGKGTFTTSIADNISGIDSYSTYFVNPSAVSRDSKGNVTGVSGEPIVTVTGVSKNEKVTSVDNIEFETDEADKLASGEYTAVVYSKNLSGNESYKTADVIVDNTTPQITGFEITTTGGNDDYSSKNGVYSKGTVTVKMLYKDDPCSAGIKTTQFYNGNNKLGDGSSDTVTLEENGSYQISGLVTDEFGHVLDEAQQLKSLPVKLNGEVLTVDAENFEINVMSDSAETDVFDISDFGYSFDYSHQENVDGALVRVVKAGENGEISLTVKNDQSGIKKIETKLTYNDSADVTSKVTVTISNNETDKDAYGKYTKQDVTVDARQLNESGKYDLSVTVTDMCGNSETKEDTFYIDTTAPEFVTMDIHKANPTLQENVLNILSFGLYSNDDYEITVRVKDDGPSCGIDHSNISLTSQKGLSISETSFTEEGNSIDGKSYTVNYKLQKTGNDDEALDKSSYKDIVFWCKDNFDNLKYDKNFVPQSDVTVNGTESVKLGEMDIVSTVYAPKITNPQMSGKNEYTDKNMNIWYSGNPTLTFNATDNVSALHSIEVKLNGVDVSQSCTVDGNPYTGAFTSFDGVDGEEDTKVDNEIKVELDTEKVKDNVNEGYNIIEAAVTSNNSVESEQLTKVFYVDTEKPEVESVTFSAAENVKDYGIYNNKAIEMTVVVYDPLDEKGNCSGLNTTEIRENGTALTPDSSEASGNKVTLKYTVDISYDIHGFTFYSKDNVNNEAEYELLNNNTVVIADESVKDYEVVATIAKPNISDFDIIFTHNLENTNYYSGEGSFTTNITDDIAGIDEYATYFVKTSEVKKDGDGNIIRDNLVPQKSVSGVSDSGKVTSVDIVINTPKEDLLESNEYTAIVYAKNLSGNDYCNPVDIVVDNTTPVITGYKITADGGDADTYNKNGVYSAQDITVEMLYTDDPCSAGIQSTQFYNGEDKFGDGSSSTITLTDNGSYQISGVVTDKFGHVSENKSVKDVPVTLNGKAFTVDPSNFEIVVNKDKSALKYSTEEPVFKFHYNNDKNIFKPDGDGDGTITASVENQLSGIKEYTAIVTSSDVDQHCDVTPSGETKDIYGKVTAKTLTIDASKLPSGTYHVVFTATDLGGVSESIEDDFYIDKTIPTYTKMEIDKKNSVVDSVLNILTFGMYSNDDLRVTVYFEDEGPSSGIVTDDVVLSCEGAKKIDAESFEETTDSEHDPYITRKYVKKFILKKTAEDDPDSQSFYNDLKIQITDNYENVYANQYPSNVTANNDPFVIDGNNEIVATAKKPDVTINSITGENKYTATDGKIWFSADPTLTFNVTDNVSKIHTISVLLNGNDVTKYVGFGEANELKNESGIKRPGVFTDFTSHQGNSYNSIDAKLDTKVVSNYVVEGENTIIITAKGNNSSDDYDNMSTKITRTFFLDTTVPVITHFDFYGTGNSDVEGIPASYEQTNYGFFFKDTTTVEVTANDGDGSGVCTIHFKAVDINGTVKVEEFKNVSNENKASFVINAGFKGGVFAYAVDNVANKGISYDPENTVVESQAQHQANTDVSFNLPNTSYKDNSGHRLYPNTISISFTAESKYAGIREVKYYVTSKYDKGKDYEGTITIGHNGTASEKIDSSVRYVDPKGNTTNLVTSLTKTLAINNNSNDIVVKVVVIDRAGWGSEKEYTSDTFSIDTVAPSIRVEWNPTDGNKVANGDFYKVDRTATITVTERNFNPDQFKYPITNTDGPVPRLVGTLNWSTNYGFAADPDKTEHKATITFHDDGDYNMETSYTDLAGHDSPDNGKKEREFTIDQTAPKISITFDLNNSNSYYNQTRTATIRIEEHNFITDAGYLDIKQTATGPDNTTSAAPPSVSGWSTSGNVSTATITFANDGKYSFTVDFKDKALNEAVQQRADVFYIDKKIDKLEIINVEDLTAYDGEVAPVINYFDNNFAEGTYTLKRIDYNKDPEAADNLVPSESSGGGYSKVVVYSDFERVPENDGIYQLNAHIKDKAGNEEKKDVLFSVNRYGSTFIITDAATKNLVEEKFYTNNAPDIIITEINVNEVTNPAVQINKDDSTKALENGKDYQFVQNSGGRQSWFAYDYKVFKNNFENEGNYVLTVSSTDKFKKTISNRTAYKETDKEKEQIDRTCPVAFVVDKTAPVVTITGIDSDEYYEEAAKSVIVNCDDANITTENLKVEFDGEELKKDVDYEITSELPSNVEVKLELEADGKDIDRSFNVIISDKADNYNDLAEGGEVTRFRLSASWLARLLHYNLPIVIAVGAVLLAGIALFVVLLVRKRKKNQGQ